MNRLESSSMKTGEIPKIHKNIERPVVFHSRSVSTKMKSDKAIKLDETVRENESKRSL